MGYLTILILTAVLVIFAKPAYGITIEEIFPPADFFKDVPTMINILLPNLVLLAAIIVFLFVIGAGFYMIQGAGSGDAKAVEKGKNALKYAIIGFLLIVFAYTIIQAVEYVTKVPILSPGF